MKNKKAFTLIELERSKSVRRNESFTLIELLVVIAIIGLISSIVLVNLKGTRGKARIAKALDLSSTIRHTLGAYAVGIWRFEEIGDIALDSSGYGNHGTIHGATYEDGIFGSALRFDGVDDYVDCGNDASLDITDAITIEMWIKVASQDQSWESFIYKGGDRLETGVSGAKGIWANGLYVTNVWEYNQWFHLAYVSTIAPETKLYINGEQKGNTWTGTRLPLGAGILKIGTCESETFNGTIDEVYIYDQALSSTEIRKHYAEGLEKHKNLTIK